jgi:hypothetical protein
VNSTSVRCTKVKSETCNIIYTVLTSICLSPLQFTFLVAEAIIHIFTAEQQVYMLGTFFYLTGTYTRRWVDNIRKDLGEVGWSDVDWIGLAKDRNRWRALVNSVLNLRVP